MRRMINTVAALTIVFAMLAAPGASAQSRRAGGSATTSRSSSSQTTSRGSSSVSASRSSSSASHNRTASVQTNRSSRGAIAQTQRQVDGGAILHRHGRIVVDAGERNLQPLQRGIDRPLGLVDEGRRRGRQDFTGLDHFLNKLTIRRLIIGLCPKKDIDKSITN